jgi:hypothetical protein
VLGWFGGKLPGLGKSKGAGESGSGPRGKGTPSPDGPASVTPGGRANGKAVAGHGWYFSSNGMTPPLPKGMYLHFYVEHGEKLLDSVGTMIERGARNVKPVQTYGPGDRIPDYLIGHPEGLNIMSGSIIISDERLLSEMIADGTIGGVCHMAICREELF